MNNLDKFNSMTSPVVDKEGQIRNVLLILLFMFLVFSLPAMLAIAELFKPNLYGKVDVTDIEQYKKVQKVRRIVQAVVSFIICGLAIFVYLFLYKMVKKFVN